MESETKDQTDIDYNRFFYATMCHVCKRFDVPLKRCSGCKLISYCGQQHQKQHWAQHKPLCKAVKDVLKDYDLDKLEVTRDNLNTAKVFLLEAVGKKKGSLKLYESQMFFYPKECAVCHEQNAESLIDCRYCALSFCENHKDDIAHKDACALLELCFRINLSIMFNQQRINKYVNTFLEHSSNTEATFAFVNMKDFINGCRKVQEVHWQTSYDILAAHLSEHLTRPMTLCYVMQGLNYIPKRKEQVIHVVGASDIEEYTSRMWEILLHLSPGTEVSLTIVIIGTRLDIEYHSLSICDNCLSQGKKIWLEFHGELYEDYVRSMSFVKPDFAVAFNADIQTEDDDIFTPELTERSVQMLAEQNCPFLITNNTQEKLEKQANRINTILNRKVDYVYCGKNPYASLRPNRRIKGPELVFYSNNFVAIYRSLC